MHVSTDALFDVFGKNSDELTAPDLSETEKKSLLKLIAAMSINGYRFDPKANRSEAISDISSDLELLGLSLDLKTIRKWLRAAAELVPDENGADGL